MKNFKVQHQSKGFMFAEVAIALAVMAVLLTPVLMLQYTVFKRVVINRDKIEHFIPINGVFGSVLIDQLKEDERMRQQDLQEPPMQIIYEQQRVAGDFKRFKDLFIEKVTGTWQGFDRKEEAKGVQFVFVPEQSKKEQKQ